MFPICKPPGQKPTMEEQLYVMELKHELSRYFQDLAAPQPAPALPGSRDIPGSGQVSNVTHTIAPAPIRMSTFAPAGPRSMRMKDKFSLIKDVNVNQFYDLVVQVKDIYHTQYESCDVKVTDYTSNNLLREYRDGNKDDDDWAQDGDPYGHVPSLNKSRGKWHGPWGQLVLKVEVREPHKSYIRQNVEVDDIVEMRNVRIKLGRDQMMEANLYHDQHDREKVLVCKKKAESLNHGPTLLARKDEYWAKYARKQDNATNPPERKKGNKGKAKARKQQDRKGGRSSEDELADRNVHITTAINKHGTAAAYSKPI